jgi:hypothetical protein
MARFTIKVFQIERLALATGKLLAHSGFGNI